MQLPELTRRLSSFVGDEFETGATLGDVSVSDGHAGLTFLFDVRSKSGRETGYVIKIPPKGVRYKGNTDVYRQAPLLRALRGYGLPVPEVPWAFEDNSWFDRPFIVMERLPGRVFLVWDPHRSFSRARADIRHLWRQCIEQLPHIHEFDWKNRLPDWDQPEPVADNVSRWRRIYAQAPDPSWIAAAEQVEESLLATLPEKEPFGLFHGDYQPGNVLYEQTQLTGIVDWELSGIGSQLLDVGWLMMICDPMNWVDEWRPVDPPSPEEARRLYESATGRTFETLPWYQAFAGYRLASIGCLNVKLHRKGQRPDQLWEKMAPTVLPMFSRAHDILGKL
ncbi:MAG TPA: phosphotransferase family protein [Gammaproteobacteria bacterium]|nr:phosphotransferase family protein [Gammaproteobacteria bacterium]